MELRNDQGQLVRLVKPLTRPGGEGQVFLIENSSTLVAKIYHQPAEPRKVSKLQFQVRVSNPALQSIAAWPTSLLLDPKNKNILRGIIMPRMSGKEIHKLYGPADRAAEYPSAGWDFLIHTAMNCAAAFETIHEHGVVMADVNEGNLLVNEKTGEVGLIDCDSYQIKNGNGCFLCDVGIPMWTPPELQGMNFRGLQRTPNHDRFGLAVMIFRLLYMGRHPFAGIPTTGDQFEIEEAIKKFLFAFTRQTWTRGVKPPPYSLSLGAIPERLGHLFDRAFLQGSVAPNARPTGREWALELKALLAGLKKGCIDPGHKFWNGLTSCPWCEIANAGGPNFFISVSVHFDSSNLSADLSSFYEVIDRVLHGSLMREQIVLPSIGKATPRIMPFTKPVAPALMAPTLPVRPALPNRGILPAPNLPPKPVKKLPVPIAKMPLGPNERTARLCVLGSCFFAVFALFDSQLAIDAARLGAFGGIVICLVVAVIISGRARREHTLRIKTWKDAQVDEQQRVDREFAQNRLVFEAKTAELMRLHAKALAQAEIAYQQDWLKLDQAYQVEFSLYLTNQKQFEVAQREYQSNLKQWTDECEARHNCVSQWRGVLDNTVNKLREALSSYQTQVQSQVPMLEAARKRFEQSKLDEISDIRKLHQKRQDLQLQQFLKNQLLQNAEISNIGPSRKATLSAYGVGSAWDIRSSMNVPGFKTTLIANLLAWREQCIRRFHYNPNTPLPLVEVNAVKIKYAQTRQSALTEIRGGAAKLEALEGKMRATANHSKIKILGLARELAQAQADLDAIS